MLKNIFISSLIIYEEIELNALVGFYAFRGQ